jgi:methylmalonyl-CoA mutase cobalamin-binding subunit
VAAVDGALTGAPDLAAARRRYCELLETGQRRAALREAMELIEADVPLADLVLEVLAPAQAVAAERRAQGRAPAAQERLATEVADVLLTMAAARRRPTGDRARLVLCVADRSHHNLPPRMVAELLRDAGHPVVFLGAVQPRPGLADTFRAMRADAVVISCSLALNLPNVLPIVEAVHAAGMPAIAGGAAFGTDLLRAARLGADGHAGRVGQVQDVLAAPQPGGIDGDRALQQAELRASREPLAGELAESIGYRLGSLLPRDLRVAPRRLREDVRNVLLFLEASILCDDAIAADYAVYLRDRMALLGGEDLLVPALLRLVGDRLGPDLPAVGAPVQAALEALGGP